MSYFSNRSLNNSQQTLGLNMCYQLYKMYVVIRDTHLVVSNNFLILAVAVNYHLFLACKRWIITSFNYAESWHETRNTAHHKYTTPVSSEAARYQARVSSLYPKFPQSTPIKQSRTSHFPRPSIGEQLHGICLKSIMLHGLASQSQSQSQAASDSVAS